MNNPTVELVPLDLIDPNPVWKRPINLEYVRNELAPDIAEHGMQENPKGRVDPANPQRRQICYGGHRVEAYRELARQDPERWGRIPFEVAALDDKQMLVFAIGENRFHNALNPIDRIQAAMVLMEQFGATQAEAGATVGWKQEMVSNMKAIATEYPVRIQELVARGELPFEPAYKLRGLARLYPTDASKAATIIAKAEPGDRKRIAAEVLAQTWSRVGTPLAEVSWPHPWQPEPDIYTEILSRVKGAPAEPRVCENCPLIQVVDKVTYCGSRACFTLKREVWRQREARRLSAKHGVPLVAAGEDVTLIWKPEDYRYQGDNPQRLLKLKPPELRLSLVEPAGDWKDQYRTNSLGAPFLALAATDRAKVLRVLDKSFDRPTVREPINKAERENETEKQREQRLAKRRAELEAKAEAESLWQRECADCHWLIEHTAELVAFQLQICGPVLVECEDELTMRDHVGEATGMTLYEYTLEQHIAALAKGKPSAAGSTFYHGTHKVKLSASDTLRWQGISLDDLRRMHILYNMFVNEVFGNYGGGAMVDYQAKYLSVPKVIGAIEDRVRLLALTLPNDWNVIPIHHTSLNCWRCGKFSRDPEHITPTELKRGWRIEGKAEAPTAVYCPECALAQAEEKEEAETVKARSSKGKKKAVRQ